jgi:hypothetical protein
MRATHNPLLDDLPTTNEWSSFDGDGMAESSEERGYTPQPSARDSAPVIPIVSFVVLSIFSSPFCVAV